MSKYIKYKDLLRDIPLFPDIFTNGITRNLAHPKKSLMGLYTKRIMEKYNHVMIKNVVKLCQIQAHHAILEDKYFHSIMSKYINYEDLLRDIPLFPDIFTNGITRNLAHPKKSMMGLYTKRTMEKYNHVMIKNAVKLCQIQAHHAILEVGFGPGLGLQEALKYLTDPRGKLFGLDVSEYMHKVARERLGPQLASGRVHLLQGRVECIPLPDHCIHGVFHSNCHLYWSDMASATAELLRVMRPGAKILATCDLGFLRRGVEQGFFKGMTVEPEPYLQALRAVGFLGVSMEDLTDEGKSFQVIYATSPPPSTTETQTSQEHTLYAHSGCV